MDKIASFQVDHTVLLPGMYLSRTDGDIMTYDLRFIRPNTPPFLENGTLHTIEHLFATYIRNSPLKDGIIYFGPMGCRTGFYLITRGISHTDAIDITKKALHFIANYNGDIPGAAKAECGNYLEHNLNGARKQAKIQLEVLVNWEVNQLVYAT
ncbi:MAG: S-ribosylhomocysteine lyase [Oscillospiraceae bacterium]|nr:S-ribosylhomocysteine lyase [Oscillospiraceae bacterium]MDD4413967.1 S-ribosylhomocysteine lyase [Oscillospiraceae bacterium]